MDSKKYKTIIAGSRTVTDKELVFNAIFESGIQISEVVCGCADGVDSIGEEWAIENGVPYKKFPPDYSKGKKAPLIRNTQMANYGEALILVWDGKSSGSRDMLSKAITRKLLIFKKIIDMN